MDGFGRADAAKGGEDNGEEGAALSHAASEMSVVLLEGTKIEDVGDVGGAGGGGVGGKEGAGDGDVDGGDGGGAVVGGDDEVDLGRA